MRVLRSVIACALLGVLAAAQARAGEIYSYVDDDGVMHFSNVPTDKRYKKLRVKPSGGGVYRSDARTEAAVASPAKAKRLTKSAALEKYRDHIQAAAQKYSLPEELLLAVMAVESAFRETALSEKGAMGLMQLMPGTARDMYVSDAWSPEQNIDGGARYLRILANQYEGDLIRTLAAYNAGPEAVRRAGGKVPNIPETQAYVRKVLALYQAFRAGK
ncbi:MAG TPA: lytic transglycosylase domain-containing protein [Anaeromyxobacter sp.]|nr:lytic transglycosylase domain-containing protein [Anaeromyxobacter sp.]